MEFNNEPLIKQKEYNNEEYMSKKRKSIALAKRIIIMSSLSYVFVINIFVSLGLFLVLILGTSALPYFFDVNIDFSPETFIFRGGVFCFLSCIFLILFSITSFWYIIGYKVLEVICIQLDGILKGAFEVENLASNMENTSSKYSSIAGAIAVTANYLVENNIKIPNTNIFKNINIILIFSQIIIAIAGVFFLMK